MKLVLFPQRKSCYCAFCKIPRKVYRNKNLSLLTMFGLIGLGIVMTYTIWHSFNPRGLAIVGFLLIVGEVLTQIKWRQSMICQNCGFDAVLYTRDPEKAAQKIKDFLDYRATRPEYLLRPAVQMPKRKVHTGKSENISLRG
jgi:hypothetical protein